MIPHRLPEKHHLVGLQRLVAVRYDDEFDAEREHEPARRGKRCDAFVFATPKEVDRVVFLVEKKGSLQAEPLRKARDQFRETTAKMKLTNDWTVHRVIFYTGTTTSELLKSTKLERPEISAIKVGEYHGPEENRAFLSQMWAAVDGLHC